MKKFIIVSVFIGIFILSVLIYIMMPSDQTLLALDGNGTKYNSKDKFMVEWQDNVEYRKDQTGIDKGNTGNSGGVNGGVDVTGAPSDWKWPTNAPGIPDISQGAYSTIYLPGNPRPVSGMGCGVCALTLARNYLECDIIDVPEFVNTLAQSGMWIAGEGMSWTAPGTLAAKMGWQHEQLDGNPGQQHFQKWIDTFAKGGTVVASVGGDNHPNPWSTGGHIINIRGYDKATGGFYVSHSGSTYTGGDCETAWPTSAFTTGVKASWTLYNPNRKPKTGGNSSIGSSGSSQGTQPASPDPNKAYLQYKQYDPKWGSEKLGGTGGTMKAIGCALVTIDMIANDAGVTTDNPSQANSKLTSVKAIDNGGSLFYSKVIDAYPGITCTDAGCAGGTGKKNYDLLTDTGLSSAITDIATLQSQGYYIDVHIDYKKGLEGDHHVYALSAGNGVITVADPGANGSDLVSTYKAKANPGKVRICCFRLFKKN